MESTIQKVAMYCQVDPEQVVAIHDVKSVYYVPQVLEQQGFIGSLTNILELDDLNISTEQKLEGTNT
jgi:CTP synthase